MSFVKELGRRNVFRVGATYAIVAWLLVQVADVLLPVFAAPAWVMQTLVLFLAVGFVVALIAAWALEMTPEGLKRTESSSDDTVAATSKRGSDIVLGVVVIAVIYLMIDQLLLDVLTNERRATPIDSGFTSRPMHLTLTLPERATLAVDAVQPVLALSPDGSRIAFVAYQNGVRRLFLRPLADETAEIIAGSEGALMPFFSADGESLAFVVGSSYRIVSASGGVPITGVRTTGGSVTRGTAWLPGDVAVEAMSANGELQARAMLDDGPARGIGAPDVATVWPSRSPISGQVFVSDTSAGGPDQAVVSRVSLIDGAVTPLGIFGTGQQYSPSGHLVYGRAGTLYATAYDAESGQVIGEEQRLLGGVLMNQQGGVQFSISEQGDLAYVPGTLEQATEELVLVDRDGRPTILLDDGGAVRYPRLSPDGTLLAVTRPTGAAVDIWTLDLRRRSLLQQWTDDFGEDFGSAWSPDSRRLAIASEIGNLGPGLALIDGPGRTPIRQLDDTAGAGTYQIPADWSPDGRYILYIRYEVGPREDQLDLYMFDTENGMTAPYVASEHRETAARFSPNGQWVAYTSDSSGQLEVYLDTFPVPSGTIKVSLDGGDEPAWAPDGDEIFYRNGERMFSVAFTPAGEDRLEAPVELFSGRYVLAEGDDQANYDVAADGDHFYMVRAKNQDLPTGIEIIQNWPAALGSD